MDSALTRTQFALDALVAVGHVTQAKVDAALASAPAAPAADVRESEDAARLHAIALGVADAAREALDGGDDQIDTINIPSHLAAVLSVRLDDYDAARASKGGA